MKPPATVKSAGSPEARTNNPSDMFWGDFGNTPAPCMIASAAEDAIAVTRKPPTTAPALRIQVLMRAPSFLEQPSAHPACATGSHIRHEHAPSRLDHPLLRMCWCSPPR